MEREVAMYKQEGDKSGFVESLGVGIRNTGILAGMLGLIAMLASPEIGGKIFLAGVGLGVVGETGRRLAGSGK